MFNLEKVTKFFQILYYSIIVIQLLLQFVLLTVGIQSKYVLGITANIAAIIATIIYLYTSYKEKCKKDAKELMNKLAEVDHNV